MSLTRQIDGNKFGSELTRDSSEDEQPRLYALTKAELELLVVRTFQRDVGPMLESLIGRIQIKVNEQFELAQQKISENETSTSEPRSLQLQFLNKISLPVLTGKDIEGEECDPIKLALVDCLTGEVVKFGAEAAAVVEIVIVEGEFKDGERTSWTHEEFNDKIVREREGRKSILRGNTYLKLKEGTGSLGRISITHNSDWMKNCKLRIGARVVDNSSGIRIKEAISESFPVKDRRSKLYEKHYPPSLCDEVWRLVMIGKKGAFYKRLSGAKITTVKDFLTLLSINPRRLQNILKAPDRTWKIIIEHARTCLIGKGMYVYYNVPNSQEKTGVLFDVEGVPVGLLKESQWDAAHRLVESASEHWEEVLSYDDESFQMHGSIHSMHSSGADSSTDRNLVTSPMIDDSEINTDEFFVKDDSGQVPYSPIYTPELNESWRSFLIENLQSESPFLESHANQENDANYFPLIDPGTVHRVRRRWIKLYCWTQWFSVMKRVGALEKAHVQKKQRIY
ncbi:hypothetical protein RJ640_005284 [Escallonia rubra]|uniref:Calmodulin-binding protein n=1 Tax=Escallonia rubra TaxID=112253 RepID=A0AA88QI67_9ASTE|nr:hypothetical protein RJ640_005284 [Escallonia rubra]